MGRLESTNELDKYVFCLQELQEHRLKKIYLEQLACHMKIQLDTLLDDLNNCLEKRKQDSNYCRGNSYCIECLIESLGRHNFVNGRN